MIMVYSSLNKVTLLIFLLAQKWWMLNQYILHYLPVLPLHCTQVLPSRIPQSIEQLLAAYNMYWSHGQTLPLLLTSFLNTCISRLQNIGSLWNVSCAIYVVPLVMAFSFTMTPPSLYMPLLMQARSLYMPFSILTKLETRMISHLLVLTLIETKTKQNFNFSKSILRMKANIEKINLPQVRVAPRMRLSSYA